MSQEQLGAPTYSRSYMSLVESGTRPPTEEVITHVADKLQLDRAVVAQWHTLDGQSVDIAAAVAQIEVLSACIENDLGEVTLWARRLRDLATEEERLGLWWTSTYASMMCLFHSGGCREARDAATSLRQHWLTASSRALSCRVDCIRSQILRACGALDEAIAAAQDAIDAATSIVDPDVEERPCSVLLPAWTSLLSSLSDQGRLGEAYAAAGELTQLVTDPNGSDIDRGRAYWALGDLHFLSGHHEQGRQAHDLAISLIDPQRHLRLYGRLHRSSAAMRIKSGSSSAEEIPALLEKARAVASLSATAADLADLLITEGLYLASRRKWAKAQESLTRGLEEEEILSLQTRAEAYESLGMTAVALGRTDEGIADLRTAVGLFVELGAHSRALDICRDHGVTPPRKTRPAPARRGTSQG